MDTGHCLHGTLSLVSKKHINVKWAWRVTRWDRGPGKATVGGQQLQDLKDEQEGAMGGGIWEEGTASAKALRQACLVGV